MLFAVNILIKNLSCILLERSNTDDISLFVYFTCLIFNLVMYIVYYIQNYSTDFSNNKFISFIEVELLVQQKKYLGIIT